jgi:hypothetical protein
MRNLRRMPPIQTGEFGHRFAPVRASKYGANAQGGHLLVTPMGTAVVMMGRIVASQCVVPAQLIWCEDGSLRQMCSEVHSTQLPLKGCNLSDQLLDLGLGKSVSGKQSIQGAFPRNELGA